LFISAAIFANGVTYFWPTMIGFFAEYIPNSEVMRLSSIGKTGMFATYIFSLLLGLL